MRNLWLCLLVVWFVALQIMIGIAPIFISLLNEIYTPIDCKKKSPPKPLNAVYKENKAMELSVKSTLVHSLSMLRGDNPGKGLFCGGP